MDIEARRKKQREKETVSKAKKKSDRKNIVLKSPFALNRTLLIFKTKLSRITAHFQRGSWLWRLGR